VTDYILRNGLHKPNAIENFSKLESLLVKKFVAVESVSKHKHQYVMLRTPKVIRHQAVKSVISNLKTFNTNLEKHLDGRKKYPNARAFKKELKFNPKFKSKKNWVSDSIGIEKRSFKYLTPTTLSLFKTTDPINNFKTADIAHHTPRKLHVYKKQAECFPGGQQHRTVEKNCVFKTVKIKCKPANPSKNRKTQRLVLEPVMFEHDFKIHVKLGKVFLLPNVTKTLEGNIRSREKETESVGAVDPGIRKFLTIYSPEGRVDVIGTNTNKKLDKSIKRIDRAKKDLKDFKHKFNRYKKTLVVKKNGWCQGKKKACLRFIPGSFVLESLRGRKMKKILRTKLWRRKKKYHAAELKAVNIVKDLHYKSAHHLCKNYDTVLYPNFNANAIAGSSTLNKQVKRRLNMLSFFKFKTRLQQTATWYPTVLVKHGTEAYTSKQCGHCGYLNDNLKGKETFQCGNCFEKGDRDVHAARNILLRFIDPPGTVFEVKKAIP